MSLSRTRLLLVASSVLALSACVVAPYPRHAVYGAPGYGAPVYGAPVPMNEGPVVVVDVAPPAPYVEVVPVMPYPGAFWIGGYWGWNGGRHAWVPGGWHQPRPGYVYRPHAWVQNGGRWHQHGGVWVRG